MKTSSTNPQISIINKMFTTILSIILIAIVIIPWTVFSAKPNKKEVWDLHRWHSIRWMNRTRKTLEFDLHLFPPKTFDQQSNMVFIRNILKNRIPSCGNGVKWEMNINGTKFNYVAAGCFNSESLTLSILDINLNDVFQNDITIIHYIISYPAPVTTNTPPK